MIPERTQPAAVTSQAKITIMTRQNNSQPLTHFRNRSMESDTQFFLEFGQFCFQLLLERTVEKGISYLTNNLAIYFKLLIHSRTPRY